MVPSMGQVDLLILIRYDPVPKKKPFKENLEKKLKYECTMKRFNNLLAYDKARRVNMPLKWSVI